MTQKTVGSASKISAFNVTVPAGTTATKLVDARPGRRSIIIRASGDGNTTFRIGPDSSVGVGDAFGMAPGESIQIETEAEIWAAIPTASSPTGASILETYD